MGGEGKSKSKHVNIIRLYASEHFIAHKLLAIENPENYKLVSAWHKMFFISDNQQRYEPTPEEYEECRKLYAAQVSIYFKSLWQSETYRQKMVGKPSYERTLEWRQHMSEIMTGRKFSEETHKKMSYSARHKPPVTQETRLKMSAANSGKNNGMYGKHHTEEAKQVQRELASKNSKGCH